VIAGSVIGHVYSHRYIHTRLAVCMCQKTYTHGRPCV